MTATVVAIIVNYRTPDLVALNLSAMATELTTMPGLSAIVVDGGSGDRSAEKIASHIEEAGWAGWVRLRALDTNGGFGWANNHAIREAMRDAANPDYIYLVNPDAVVRPGAIQHLVDALALDLTAGAAGSRLLDENGAILGSAFRFPTIASEFYRGADTDWIARLFRLKPLRVDPCERARVDWVTGASVMFRAEALRSAGLFDDGFFLYFEEVELMHRMREAGWHILHEPLSEVVHVGGASTGVGVTGAASRRLPDYWFRSRLRFLARTRGRAGALAMNLAWLAGKALWGCRVLARVAPAGRSAPGEVAGVFRAGLWPSAHDVSSHGTGLDEGESLPAWMARK